MRSKYRWAGVFISANPECHSPITDRTGTRPPRNPAAPFSASFSGCWIFFAHSRSHNLCVRLPLSGALGSVLSLCTLSCYGCYCYCCSYFIFFLISPLFCVLPCYFFFCYSWRYRQRIGDNNNKTSWGSIRDVALRCLSVGSQALLSTGLAILVIATMCVYENKTCNLYGSLQMQCSSFIVKACNSSIPMQSLHYWRGSFVSESGANRLKAGEHYDASILIGP